MFLRCSAVCVLCHFLQKEGNTLNIRSDIVRSALVGEFLPSAIRKMSALEVGSFTIHVNTLPPAFDGLKIAHLSDLHNKKYGENGCELFELIQKQNPDIVVMTGDMISHSAVNREDFIGLTKSLAEKYPTFYVNGNHEFSDMSDELFAKTAEQMKAAGAVCLDNAEYTIYKDGQKLNLCGVSYEAKFYRGVREYKRNWEHFTLDEMERLCGKKPDGFTILLAHNPLDFAVYAEWGADVTFGGHIHGGSVRLPIVGGVFSPELKARPKYYEGVYRLDDKRMAVSRGLGRIRLFNPPELLVATLSVK